MNCNPKFHFRMMPILIHGGLRSSSLLCWTCYRPDCSDIMSQTTQAIPEILQKSWLPQDCTLVDMKVQIQWRFESMKLQVRNVFLVQKTLISFQMEFDIDATTKEIVLAGDIDDHLWRLCHQEIEASGKISRQMILQVFFFFNLLQDQATSGKVYDSIHEFLLMAMKEGTWDSKYSASTGFLLHLAPSEIPFPAEVVPLSCVSSKMSGGLGEHRAGRQLVLRNEWESEVGCPQLVQTHPPSSLLKFTHFPPPQVHPLCPILKFTSFLFFCRQFLYASRPPGRNHGQLTEQHPNFHLLLSIVWARRKSFNPKWKFHENRKSALFIVGHPWASNTQEPVSLDHFRQNEAYIPVNQMGDG